MPKYCPTCGNYSDKIRFFGNFCEDCTKAKFLGSVPKEVEIQRCKSCGRIKAAGAFAEPGSQSLRSAISQQLGRYSVKLLGNPEGSTAKLRISEETPEGVVSAEHDVSISYKKVLCDRCYKKACNYHEAVVQLRGSRQRSERMLEKIARYFDERDGFVTKVEEADNGIDVYLSSKKLASAFMSRMGLKPVVSYTLVGVKKGRKVYKNTYALRFS